MNDRTEIDARQHRMREALVHGAVNVAYAHVPRLMWDDAKPGDVCNDFGDIRMPDEGSFRRMATTGRVYVTRAQAEKAKEYGWRIDDEGGELVIVERP